MSAEFIYSGGVPHLMDTHGSVIAIGGTTRPVIAWDAEGFPMVFHPEHHQLLSVRNAETITFYGLTVGAN